MDNLTSTERLYGTVLKSMIEEYDIPYNFEIFGEEINRVDPETIDNYKMYVRKSEGERGGYIFRHSNDGFGTECATEGCVCGHWSWEMTSVVFTLFEQLEYRPGSQFKRADILTESQCNLLIEEFSKRIEISWDVENTYTRRMTVAMIGSTRFMDTFIEECWKLSMQGYVVSLPNFRPKTMMSKGFDIPEDILEDIGFKRIEMADLVFVVNEGGYVGSSTNKEIQFATELNKPIRFMEETKGDEQ